MGVVDAQRADQRRRLTKRAGKRAADRIATDGESLQARYQLEVVWYRTADAVIVGKFDADHGPPDASYPPPSVDAGISFGPARKSLQQPRARCADVESGRLSIPAVENESLGLYLVVRQRAV